MLQVHNVERDRSLCGVEEAEEEVGQRGLARACRAYHSKAIARGQLEGNVPEDRVSWRVFEGYVLEGYLASCPSYGKGVRSLWYVRFLVQNCVTPFHSG